MASNRPKSPTFWLELKERVIPLVEGEYVLGRAPDVDLCFPEEPTLSRRHALLVVCPEGVFIEDLGSQNGTWLGGVRLRQREPLASGTLLRAGDLELVLHAVGRRERAAETVPEIPSARAARAAELSELTTQRTVDMELGLRDAKRALERGQLSEARALIDEYVSLLEVASSRVSSSLLDQTAIVAMRFAAASGEGRYADWVSSIHRRLERALSDELLQLAAAADARNVPFDKLAFGIAGSPPAQDE